MDSRDSCSPEPPAILGGLIRLQQPQAEGAAGSPPSGAAPPGRAAAARSRWGKLQPFAFYGAAGLGGFWEAAGPWQL